MVILDCLHTEPVNNNNNSSCTYLHSSTLLQEDSTTNDLEQNVETMIWLLPSLQDCSSFFVYYNFWKTTISKFQYKKLLVCCYAGTSNHILQQIKTDLSITAECYEQESVANEEPTTKFFKTNHEKNVFLGKWINEQISSTSIVVFIHCSNKNQVESLQSNLLATLPNKTEISCIEEAKQVEINGKTQVFITCMPTLLYSVQQLISNKKTLLWYITYDGFIPYQIHWSTKINKMVFISREEVLDKRSANWSYFLDFFSTKSLLQSFKTNTFSKSGAITSLWSSSEIQTNCSVCKEAVELFLFHSLSIVLQKEKNISSSSLFRISSIPIEYYIQIYNSNHQSDLLSSLIQKKKPDRTGQYKFSVKELMQYAESKSTTLRCIVDHLQQLTLLKSIRMNHSKTCSYLLQFSEDCWNKMLEILDEVEMIQKVQTVQNKWITDGVQEMENILKSETVASVVVDQDLLKPLQLEQLTAAQKTQLVQDIQQVIQQCQLKNPRIIASMLYGIPAKHVSVYSMQFCFGVYKYVDWSELLKLVQQLLIKA